MSCISKLSAEVLIIIFTQCVDGLTPLSVLPRAPVQTVISVVCSSWRRIALSAGELWANVYIEYPFILQEFYSAWLTRAGQHTISLHLNFGSDWIKPPISSTFWKFVKQFPIRRLGLTMYAKDFNDLWASGQDALPYLERLDIQLYIGSTVLLMVSNIPEAVIGKTRSAMFYHGNAQRVQRIIDLLALPWAQLRDLDIRSYMPLSRCIIILRQTPLLEQCSLYVSVDEAAENMGHVTLSHLQSLILLLEGIGHHLDAFIRHFTCPNLTLLDIKETCAPWDWSTMWDMIRKQYNLHRLEYLTFFRIEPLSHPILSSVIFRDAPMLRGLEADAAIIDEESCAGMVTGVFGRFLSSLKVSCKQSDVGIVLDMAKDRQLAVVERLRPDCSRQDAMASLKQLHLDCLGGTESPDTYEDEISELERLGIAVKVFKDKYIYKRAVLS